MVVVHRLSVTHKCLCSLHLDFLLQLLLPGQLLVFIFLLFLFPTLLLLLESLENARFPLQLEVELTHFSLLLLLVLLYEHFYGILRILLQNRLHFVLEFVFCRFEKEPEGFATLTIFLLLFLLLLVLVLDIPLRTYFLNDSDATAKHIFECFHLLQYLLVILGFWGPHVHLYLSLFFDSLEHLECLDFEFVGRQVGRQLYTFDLCSLGQD